MNVYYSNLIFTLAIALLCGCSQDYLDIKRNANQVVPVTISDYQAILDYNDVLNNKASFELVTIGTDEYELSDELWSGINMVYYPHVKNGYIWARDVYNGQQVNDWNWAYERIMYCNMALDVRKLTPEASQIEDWKNVQGQALFHRAYTFYQLCQAFCEIYDPETAGTSMGIPLRMDYDLLERYDRANLEHVYRTIIDDLVEASDLLPYSQSINYRPSKLAAFALLARISRELNKWDEAQQYAENVLQTNNFLLDYNDLTSSGRYTFEPYNNGLHNGEVIFYSQTSSGFIMANAVVPVDWYMLFNEMGDLRKEFFFNDEGQFIGSYAASNYFTGLAIDEVLLIRAECYLRKGELESAKTDLNYLRKHRFSPAGYKIIDDDNIDILRAILDSERKKQLYMRGVRWTDLRILSRDLEDWDGIKRIIAGQEYKLSSKDPNWVWPIPQNEVDNGGIEQNNRR